MKQSFYRRDRFSIGAPPKESHNNVYSESKIYSTRKLYRLVPYGAYDSEWVKFCQSLDLARCWLMTLVHYMFVQAMKLMKGKFLLDHHDPDTILNRNMFVLTVI